jgi:hypothetical protein
MALSGFRPLLVGLAAAFLAGCQQDEIRTYQLPKPEMTRLLGAILPHDDSTWFFKLSGPAATVSGHEAEFAAFLQSLNFSGPADQPLAWNLPQGWRQDKGNRSGRYATILVGDKDALELTIVKLGREGQAASVLANVNRWRNQLALPPVTENELPNDLKELKVEAGTITLVDMTGTGNGKTGASAPFATGDRMPPAAVKKPKSDIGHRAPEGWKKAPNTSFSKLAFEVRDGGEKASVTVTPLSEMGGGLEANVKRWREEQLGLAPLSDAEVRKLAEEIPVDGITSQYVDLRNATQRILGVRVPRSGTCWFVKMAGPIDLVGKQKANFEAFVRSLRFEGGPGGNDG